MPPGRQPDRELGVEPVDRRVVLDRHERRPVARAPGPPTAASAGTARPGGSRRSTATGARPRPRGARSSSRRAPATASRTSFHTASADASPQSWPIRRASSKMIHRSSRASPGGSSALRTRCTRRSELVTVPSVSAQAAAAGRTTSAISRRRRQEDVLDDEELEAVEQALASGAVGLGLDRVLADARRRAVSSPRSIASNMAVRFQPRFGGTVAPQAASNGARSSSFSTCWKPGSRSGSAPMSPPPWTLFWPRSGLRPLPYRPTCPVSSDEVDQREHVVDRVVVLGDAQRPADHRPVGRRRRRGRPRGSPPPGTPVSRSAYSSVYGSTPAR